MSLHKIETVDELQLDRLDWLKLNDSSTSVAILDGAVETMWRLRPMLYVAARDDEDLTVAASRARDVGYRCWQMSTSLFNPDNYNRRDSDIFGGRRALAMLAIPEEVALDGSPDGCAELT